MQVADVPEELAAMAAALTELRRCSRVPGAGHVARDAAPGRYASAQTRAALHWTRHAADTEHDIAESVVHGMPLLFAAWLSGTVDRPRVRLFDQYLTGLTPEQVERICQVAVPRAPALTTGQLARLLRRMVVAVDPDAADRWYRRGISDRNVTAYPAEDGTITVSANGLPADEAEAACRRIEQLASAAKRAGHPGRIGQIRCDLFLGLLDGRFHGMTTEQVITALISGYRPAGPAGSGDSGTGESSGSAGDQRVGIEIRIGLAALLGLDEHPAEIPGLGFLVAPAARARIAEQGRAEWRFAVTDAQGALVSEGHTRRRPVGVHRSGPPGGIVELHLPDALLRTLAADPQSCGDWADVIADIAAQHSDRDRHLADLDRRPGDRLPGAALRRHTEIRDRTCTFAGVCRRPANASEQDHSHDHAAGGATERVNLGPLCDQDHLIKHRAGWTVAQPEPGVFVWRSPLGGEYATRGEFLLPELPDRGPSDPCPWPDLPSRIVEGPILRRPPPASPAPRPAPPVEYPDEPPF